MRRLKKFLAARIIKKSLTDRILPLEDLESKHINRDEPLFNDSSYFLGRGDDGSYMVVRQAFRTTRGNEYWLRFYFPGKGEYVLEDMEAIEGKEFQLGTLEFVCQDPGKTWNIKYKGPIKKGGEDIDLELNLTFTATRRLVNFKEITDPVVTAAVIAKEKWDRKFFEKLKEIKKVHLEQGGQLKGYAILKGEKIDIDWRSIRDHSWGNRTWGSWNRHIWLGGVLDNGEAFNLSMIRYDFMGQLAAGYITEGEKVTYINTMPDMDAFASDPLIPDPCMIAFYSSDGVEHELSITFAGHFKFIMDDEYYIHEGMGNFTLDGIKGKGVAEFGFNPENYDFKTW